MCYFADSLCLFDLLSVTSFQFRSYGQFVLVLLKLSPYLFRHPEELSLCKPLDPEHLKQNYQVHILCVQEILSNFFIIITVLNIDKTSWIYSVRHLIITSYVHCIYVILKAFLKFVGVIVTIVAMVLILDRNSEIGAYVRSNLCYLIIRIDLFFLHACVAWSKLP